MNSSYLNLITQQHYLSVFSGNYIGVRIFLRTEKKQIYIYRRSGNIMRRTKYFQSDVVYI